MGSDGVMHGTVSEPDNSYSGAQVVPQPHDGSNVDINVQPNVDPKINTVTYEQDADYENAKNKGEPAPNHNIVEGTKGRDDSLSTTGEPNSSADLYNEEGLKQRRYYGPDGKAEKDIDYRHGGDTHKFPHEHYWDWSSGNPKRIP